MIQFLSKQTKEEIENILADMIRAMPQLNCWDNLYQAIFHLTENVAGKIDGMPFSANLIPSLYKQFSSLTIYDHTYGCPTKCTYCGYNTISPPPNIATLRQHIKTKEKEILMVKDFCSSSVTSLYFGGGTPTILNKSELQKLIGMYFEHFNISPDAEITIEAHPSTLTNTKLDFISKLGVNRISIGIQSLNDDILQLCNRKYSKDQAIKVIKTAVQTIPTVNVDVIYGLAQQSLSDHLQTLEQLIELGVNQFTVYALWLKEGSVVSDMFKKNEVKEFASPIERARMYLYTKYFLEQNGFAETLSGWFSKPNHDVKIYNERWASRIPCLGIGPGAYSYSDNWHYRNYDELDNYSQAVDQKTLPVVDGFLFGNNEKIITDLMWKIKSGKSFNVTQEQMYLLDEFINIGLIEESRYNCSLNIKGKALREYIIGKMIYNNSK